MPRITHAALALDALDPGVSNSILRHLGSLLRDALQPSAPAGFAALLSRIDAAMAGAGTADAEVRAGLLRLMPNLRRFAISLTHDETAAEDVVQDALMRAWRGRRGFVTGTNIEAWLFTITRNAFLSSVRNCGREINDGDDDRAARLTVIPEQGGRVDLADARAALARLPPFMREALMLVAVGEASYEEAAAILGCRIGTVKSRVWRARQRLACELGYDGSEVGGDGLMMAAASTEAQKGVPTHS